MTGTTVPPRWYIVSADGLATLCAGEQDAKAEAAKADNYYPRRAPHRAVLLGDVAAERERCAALVEPKPPRQPSDHEWLALEQAAARIRATNARGNAPDTARAEGPEAR